jgi:hypothetical protein
LFSIHSNDDDGYYGRKISSSTYITTIEWLAKNCYIDIYARVHDYNEYNNNKDNKEEEKVREVYSQPLKYCEVCRHLKLDYRKYYCYTDKGKNRQIITICTECFRRYQKIRYDLFGKPTGVIAISDKSKVESLIMCALRLALVGNRKFKGNVRGGSSNGSGISISALAASATTSATEDDADIYLSPEYNNIFYTATANAFDHSPTVREYFHDNRSRTRSDNKSLWPLRYQAYKEFGI